MSLYDQECATCGHLQYLHQVRGCDVGHDIWSEYFNRTQPINPSIHRCTCLRFTPKKKENTIAV